MSEPGAGRVLTPEECVAQGGHCYERTSMVLTSYPPQYPEKCKHCPASRMAIPREPWDYRDTTPMNPPSEGRVLTRWEGVVEVCKTCDRRAQWPFCEHKTDDGSWYRLVVVREVGRRG